MCYFALNNNYMENDNMWLDENGIQLLEQYELDEYKEKNYFTFLFFCRFYFRT